MNNPDIAAITDKNISIINCEKTTPTTPITDRNIPNIGNNDFFTILKYKIKKHYMKIMFFFKIFFLFRKKRKIINIQYLINHTNIFDGCG